MNPPKRPAMGDFLSGRGSWSPPSFNCKQRAPSTCTNDAKRESFFCLVLMISREKGWLLQKVPAACLIFSSSPPLNYKHPAGEQRRPSVNLGRGQLLWKCLIFNYCNARRVPEGGRA